MAQYKPSDEDIKVVNRGQYAMVDGMLGRYHPRREMCVGPVRRI
jgi:hypothetical protein